MPLTAKGEKILAAMIESEGSEEAGKRLFYKSKNAGTIEGVDAEPCPFLLFDTAELHLFDGERRKTSDGYLPAWAKVARVGTQRYKGYEVGLPDKDTVTLYRPEEEVFATDAMRSMANKPVTLTHPKRMVDATTWKQHAKGFSGSDVVRDGDFVRVQLMLTDADTIHAFENEGIREMSVGYTTDIDWTPGETAAGEKYDGVQRQIRANHHALVPVARGGKNLTFGVDGLVEDDRIKDYSPDQPRDEHGRWSSGGSGGGGEGDGDHRPSLPSGRLEQGWESGRELIGKFLSSEGGSTTVSSPLFAAHAASVYSFTHSPAAMKAVKDAVAGVAAHLPAVIHHAVINSIAEKAVEYATAGAVAMGAAHIGLPALAVAGSGLLVKAGTEYVIEHFAERFNLTPEHGQELLSKATHALVDHYHAIRTHQYDAEVDPVYEGLSDFAEAIDAYEPDDEDNDMADALYDRSFTAEERKQGVKEGWAKPDGSYPIRNAGDLSNAIRAWGRGGATASDKAWIIKRAKALGKTSMLPEDWGGAKDASPFNNGENRMTQVLIDGIPIEVADDKQALILQRHLAKLADEGNGNGNGKKGKGNGNGNGDDNDEDDMKDADAVQAEQDREKKERGYKDAISVRDGEIKALKQQLADSKLTDEKQDAIIAERLAVLDAAKPLLPQGFNPIGKSLADIRRAAVVQQMGDAAVKDMDDAAIVGAFRAYSNPGAKPSGVRALADGMSRDLRISDHSGGHVRHSNQASQVTMADADAAYEEYCKRIGDAYKTPITIMRN